MKVILILSMIFIGSILAGCNDIGLLNIDYYNLHHQQIDHKKINKSENKHFPDSKNELDQEINLDLKKATKDIRLEPG